ncbi:MAG: hypothetical protein ACK4E8_00485 [Lacibacter sp.]
MQKLFNAIILLSLIAFDTTAQRPPRQQPYFISIGPDVLIPDGEFDLTHRTGVGATAEIGWRAGRTLAPVAGYSWYSLPGKAGNVSLSAQIIRGGMRAYLGNLYLMGEAGTMFQTGYADGNAFVWILGAGDEIRLGRRTRIDVSGRYESFNAVRRVGVIGVRTAFTWKWGAP